MGVQEYLKEQGREQGRKEGREEEQISFVKRLLADQFAIAKIADLAGVSQAFVRRKKKGR